jgi:hypothetical protein
VLEAQEARLVATEEPIAYARELKLSFTEAREVDVPTLGIGSSPS